jgi:hypothetical protein
VRTLAELRSWLELERLRGGGLLAAQVEIATDEVVRHGGREPRAGDRPDLSVPRLDRLTISAAVLTKPAGDGDLAGRGRRHVLWSIRGVLRRQPAAVDEYR